MLFIRFFRPVEYAGGWHKYSVCIACLSLVHFYHSFVLNFSFLGFCFLRVFMNFVVLSLSLLKAIRFRFKYTNNTFENQFICSMEQKVDFAFLYQYLLILITFYVLFIFHFFACFHLLIVQFCFRLFHLYLIVCKLLG